MAIWLQQRARDVQNGDTTTFTAHMHKDRRHGMKVLLSCTQGARNLTGARERKRFGHSSASCHFSDYTVCTKSWMNTSVNTGQILSSTKVYSIYLHLLFWYVNVWQYDSGTSFSNLLSVYVVSSDSTRHEDKQERPRKCHTGERKAQQTARWGLGKSRPESFQSQRHCKATLGRWYEV